MNNIREYLKDITSKELRTELYLRAKVNKVYAKDRERCKNCVYCVSATTAAKMIRSRQIDANIHSCFGHYCILKREGWDVDRLKSIFDWTRDCCELYSKKKYNE